MELIFQPAGSYQMLPPLPNGRKEAAAAGSDSARARASETLAVLGALSNRRMCLDK